VGGALAVLLGKQVFGGIGQNLFNPAMVARVALLISFPLEMTTYVTPAPLLSAQAPGLLEGAAITFGAIPVPDAMSGATILGAVRTELGEGASLSQVLPALFDPLQSGLGTIGGSLGETSALLLLLGGLFLLYKRVITWRIPVALLGSLAAMAALMHLLDPQHYAGPVYHLLSGSTLLAAFFIATDPVTSPVSARGQLIFGAGVGLLIYVIRTWAGYPEGVAFAVLLMNACTPLIDHWVKPRIYGRDRRGEPLDYASTEPRR
jgi:electron transport complex protein RnfD